MLRPAGHDDHRFCGKNNFLDCRVSQNELMGPRVSDHLARKRYAVSAGGEHRHDASLLMTFAIALARTVETAQHPVHRRHADDVARRDGAADGVLDVEGDIGGRRAAPPQSFVEGVSAFERAEVDSLDVGNRKGIGLAVTEPDKRQRLSCRESVGDDIDQTLPLFGRSRGGPSDVRLRSSSDDRD